jgi:GAF domain-containing protein
MMEPRRTLGIAPAPDARALDSIDDVAFDAMASLSADLVGAPGAVVSLLDDEHELLLGVSGLPEAHSRGQRWPRHGSPADAIAAAGRPLVTGDTREDAALRDNPTIGRLGAVAYAGVPVRAGDGQPIGSVAAFHAEPHAWTRREIRRLTAVAALIGDHLALHRRLRETELTQRMIAGEYDEVEAQAARRETYISGLESLLAVAHRLALSPDARTGVCEAVTELADAAIAVLWEPNRAGTALEVTAEHAPDIAPRTVAPLALPLRPGLSAEADAFLTTTSGLRSATGPQRTLPTALAIEDATTIALEPVVADGETVGLLEIGWHRAFHQIPASAIALVGLLTLDASAAITRARATMRLQSGPGGAPRSIRSHESGA